MSKELTTTNGNSALAAYGDVDTVGEVFNRLMKLHPQADKLGAGAMRLVAQAAILTGANPLPPPLGEIYVWDDGRGGLSVDYYIGYYRRKASEKDTVVWVDEPRTMTEDEAERHGVPTGAIGGICKGARFSKVREMMREGIPYREALQLAGKTETAMVAGKEMRRERDTKWSKAGDPIDAPAGRTWAWVAAKRAEKAFYRAESLVDTTLTDAIENTRQAAADVQGQIERREALKDYGAADANADFFDGPDVHYEDVIDGEYEPDVEPDPEPEPTPAPAAKPKRQRVTRPAPSAVDWRAKLAANPRPTVGTVASILALAFPERWSNVLHAEGSITKRWPELLDDAVTLTPEDALNIYEAAPWASGEEEE